MNSNSSPSSPLPVTNELVSLIADGIERRGFHIADAQSLEVLWPAPDVGPIEKLRLVHLFAAAHGWEVAAKNYVNAALFQRSGRRSITPEMWRLNVVQEPAPE